MKGQKNLPGNNGQEHGSDNGTDKDDDPKPVANTTETKEPGFFTKIGNWFGNEWNSFWHTPTTRAERTKKALAVICIAAAAGGIGYAVGTATYTDSFLDDEDDDFGGSCGDEHEDTFETTFADDEDEDE